VAELESIRKRYRARAMREKMMTKKNKRKGMPALSAAAAD
jgi:hypothetical protein